MPQPLQGKTVVREDGVRGKVVDSIAATDKDKLKLVVEFSDGVRVAVPEKALSIQADGTYRLVVGAQNLFAASTSRTADVQSVAQEVSGLSVEDYETTEGDMVIPVIEEEAIIEKELIVRGAVRAHKRVETFEKLIDAMTTSEEVIVERIEVNTLLDDDIAPHVREEEGVLIIPVYEEILVVEKRLLLREEVRLSKRLTTHNVPQKITLRREVVDIERVDAEGNVVSDAKDGAAAAGGAAPASAAS
jgi:uncharacterized protein (TIGR02271 family)